MEKFLTIIEKALDEVLPRADERPFVLHQAMRYAVGAGGKRIRPVICLAAAEAAGGRTEDAVWPACAIELLHNYTLVHDDLPAMDDDVERRGKPSVWKAFGEANAILCGDALLALAYRVASRAPRNVAEIVGVLGEKGVGVVQGQVEEGVAVASRPVSEGSSDFVYLHKTADLFIAAAKMGALAAGADDSAVAALEDYARNLGLAFQYEDDLIDCDGFYGPEETRHRVEATTGAAIAALASLPGDASFLRGLAKKLVGRKS